MVNGMDSFLGSGAPSQRKQSGQQQEQEEQENRRGNEEQVRPVVEMSLAHQKLTFASNQDDIFAQIGGIGDVPHPWEIEELEQPPPPEPRKKPPPTKPSRREYISRLEQRLDEVEQKLQAQSLNECTHHHQRSPVEGLVSDGPVIPQSVEPRAPEAIALPVDHILPAAAYASSVDLNPPSLLSNRSFQVRCCKSEWSFT
jgi:hypothetical protein